MTIKSYAESELSRVEGSQEYSKYVMDILKAIAEEGHSGGSMSIFSGMFNHWAKDPKELKDNSLFSPIWNIVKDIPYGLVPITLSTVGKLMTYTPLTALTGEDDEWIKLNYDDEVRYQHNRMSNIFKDGDGRAYWLDGVIYYEPSEFFTDWHGYTGSYSKVYIDFPFDPNTEPKRVYWTTSDRTKQLEDDVDKSIWLNDRKIEKFFGREDNSTTFKTEAYCITKDKLDELLDHLKRYSLIKFEDSWLRDTFLTEPLHTLRIHKGDYESLNLTEDFIFSDRSVWLNWLRIIAECNFNFTIDDLLIQPAHRSVPITLIKRNVYVPGSNFQKLIDTDMIWITTLQHFPTTFMVDVNGRAEFSSTTTGYLYRKCKEFNLKFKQSKQGGHGE